MEIMKFLLSLFTIALATSLHAMTGTVIVHEAPIHLSDSSDTPVIQLVRKGDDLKIHDQHFGTTVFEQTKDQKGRRLLYLEDQDQSKGFYEVVTSGGQSGYILKKYIKPVYKDPREFKNPMPVHNPDIWDYRIAEPLPQGYPLYDAKKKRALFTLNLGPARHILYPYVERITKEETSSTKGFNVYYLHKASFDNTDRLYFGGNFALLGFDNEIEMEEGRLSKESALQFGIGPFLSYDPFRNEDYALTIGGGFNFNYHRYFVSQGDINGASEERMFQGFSITPKLMTSLQFKELLPYFDIIVGADALFNLPFSLKSSTPTEIPNWWQPESDQMTFPFGATLTFFIGIQGRY